MPLSFSLPFSIVLCHCLSIYLFLLLMACTLSFFTFFYCSMPLSLSTVYLFLLLKACTLSFSTFLVFLVIFATVSLYTSFYCIAQGMHSLFLFLFYCSMPLSLSLSLSVAQGMHSLFLFLLYCSLPLSLSISPSTVLLKACTDTLSVSTFFCWSLPLSLSIYLFIVVLFSL